MPKILITPVLLLALAILSPSLASPPDGPPQPIPTHYLQGKFDVTLTTAPDGRLLISVASPPTAGLPATVTLPVPDGFGSTAAAQQWANGQLTASLTTALDGHLTLQLRRGTQIVYNGPYTTPIERSEVPPELRRALRLIEIQTSFNITAGAEWDVLSAKINKVLQDQAWLETDTDGTLLVLCQPKLADPDSPLTTAARDLCAAIAPGNTTADADLKTALTKFRDAQHKVENMLATDRENLQKVVTVRQETILVRMGVLR